MVNLILLEGRYADMLYERGFDLVWRRKQEVIAEPVFKALPELQQAIAPKILHLGASQAPLLLDFISRHIFLLKAVAADRPEEIPILKFLVRTLSAGFQLEAFEEELPFADKEFDFGILTAGREDDPITDWIDPLREVCRTTKTGGLVLLTRLISPRVTLLDKTILGFEGINVSWEKIQRTDEGERLFLGGVKGGTEPPHVDCGR